MGETTMYDAIIVGARCAGSPLAMLLARRGHKVLLVDKATFPSDTMSTHAIKTPGVARLREWGLLEAVLASNVPAITSERLDLGPFTLAGMPPGTDGNRFLLAPRRHVLDTILVDAAIEAGAEMRDCFTVEELLIDDGTVIGIRGHEKGGKTVTEQAPIVVGADGRYSLVAKEVGAPKTIDRGTLCCGYYSYFADVSCDGVELNPRPNRSIIAFPTNDGLTVILVEWPRSEFHAFRDNIEGNFMQTLELTPSLLERVRAGSRAERFTGTADLPNYQRKAYGPGWALAGDALSHKDPLLAQGIVEAFHDAAHLAEAIHDGLRGACSWEAALADYERRHMELSMPLFELNCEFASLQPPPPEMQQLFGALLGNQDAIDEFLGTIDGSVSLEKFFAPENIRRLTATAA